MHSLKIRPATEADLPAINAIYNYYVIHSTATYQTVPETDAGRSQWFEHHGPTHPVTVAELHGAVVGWGSLSRFHPRQAFDLTVENSVYVSNDMHGKGIGTRLLADLLERAKEIGHHSVVAAIDGEQVASIGLHTKFGFTQCGRLLEAGFKFGRWLDVVYMQKKMASA